LRVGHAIASGEAAAGKRKAIQGWHLVWDPRSTADFPDGQWAAVHRRRDWHGGKARRVLGTTDPDEARERMGALAPIIQGPAVRRCH
jgi:hypothetical protein